MLPSVVPMWGLLDLNNNLGAYTQEQVRKLLRNEEASHTALWCFFSIYLSASIANYLRKDFCVPKSHQRPGCYVCIKCFKAHGHNPFQNSLQDHSDIF